MSDVLTLIAAIEWIALGVLVLYRLSRWYKKFTELYDERKQDGERSFLYC